MWGFVVILGAKFEPPKARRYRRTWLVRGRGSKWISLNQVVVFWEIRVDAGTQQRGNKQSINNWDWDLPIALRRTVDRLVFVSVFLCVTSKQIDDVLKKNDFT